MGLWRGLCRKNSELVTKVFARRYETTRSVLAAPYAAAYRAFLSLPGRTGNYASTPDTAALDITADIDLRVKVALVDWTPAAACALLAKWITTGNLRCYSLIVNTNGTLVLQTSNNGQAGGNLISATSTAAVPASNGQPIYVRATRDVNNGSSGNTTTFYTSLDDGANWTQLGDAVVNAGTTTIFSSTPVLEIGTLSAGASAPSAGKFYRAQVYAGLDGSDCRFNVNFEGAAVGASTVVESDASLVVTINTSGSPAAAIQEEGV